MRAVTFHATKEMRVAEAPDPGIQQPTDAIVRVTMAGICGSDLHIYNAGDAFGFQPGQRVGHEFIGVVEETGGDVRCVRPGDRVLAACMVYDGTCRYCQEGLHSSCESWSLFGWAPRVWQHGGGVEGGQSEYVRVPHADATLLPMPEALSSEEHEATLLPLVDVVSTGWHGLVGAGVKAGDNVLVVGDGAVGLSAVHGAAALGAERIVCTGHHEDRLALATRLGATSVLSSRDTEEVLDHVREHTGGDLAHAVMDSISGPESMATAQACVRPGGTISCLGMDHFMGKLPEINWFNQFLKNITITGGLVPGGRYLPRLLELVEAGKLEPSPMLTHRLPLEEGPEGYRLMAERAPGVVKVALRPAA
ncbi:MAG TPA: alcohol dehydrogenase catalytic domain-containing protein [Miltoncostaeaceae bacterium]|nr:alcohol dehydrogenase catalytic domain-containing protein [Miltoncostaeaceae bacterium]